MKIPSWQKMGTFDALLVSKKDRPLVKFVFLFPFGADRDPKDQLGLTNMMGDMLLRGSSDLSRRQIEDQLDELGASLNVYTGYHSFSIEGQILKRNFPKLLGIIQSVLSKPLFDEDELVKIKNEAIAQIRLQLDDDQGLAKTAFSKHLYQNHTYSHDVEGTAQTISNITAQGVRKHYEKYLTHANVTIGLSGDISSAMLDLSTLTLQRSLPGHELEKPTQATAPKLKGKTLLFVDKPDRSQTHFYIGHPCPSINDAAAFDFKLYSTAFAGGLFEAKYMQEIRVKRGWAYGAYGSTDFRKWANSFYLYTFPKNEDTADAIATSIDLYSQAKEGSIIAPADIDFARSYLYKSFPFKVDTPSKILSQKIHHKLLGMPDDYIETYRHNIESVQSENISERIGHYFSDDMVISVLGTKETTLKEIEDKIKPDQTIVQSFEDFI